MDPLNILIVEVEKCRDDARGFQVSTWDLLPSQCGINLELSHSEYHSSTTSVPAENNVLQDYSRKSQGVDCT